MDKEVTIKAEAYDEPSKGRKLHAEVRYDTNLTDEVNAWSERERKRRAEWLAGPSEEEKYEYACRLRGRKRYADERHERKDIRSGPEAESHSRKLLRETELAYKGAILSFWEYPFTVWSRLVRRGQEWEERCYERSQEPRVSYYD